MYNTVEEALVAIVILTTAISTLTKQGQTFWRWFWKKLKNVFGVYKRLEQHDTKLSEVADSLTVINSKLDVVVGELQVNGGNSLRDVFNMLLIDSLAETGARRAMHTDSIAFWESDADGKCTYASNKLGELVDLNPHDVLGDGWITKIHPDDVERVTRAWDMAVSQRRTFIADYRFVHDTGEIVSTQGHCHPILNGKREIVKFIGILTRKAQ